MFLSPEAILSSIEIKPGMKIADLGAGAGVYTMNAARMVSPGGKVYAIEVQKDIVTRLKNDVPLSLRDVVECIWGDIEKPGGTKLSNESVDLALVSNVFFQVEHKDDFIRELARIVKRGGRVLFIDWTEAFGGMGPDAKSVVTKEKATEAFQKYGFSIQKEIPAGDHHFGLLFVRGVAAS